MKTGDTLYDALTYALAQTGDVTAPVAAINACGLEPAEWVKQSSNACYKLENTINGVFNTLLVRATRQKEETLGLVALAAAHADPSARIYVAQENAHGAPALEKNLRRAFPDLQVLSKFKCRTLVLSAENGDAAQLLKWTENAAIQKVKHNRGEFWSAPGVFSWDRPDAGSRLLLEQLPSHLPGVAADLGCGNGFLTGFLAKKPGITGLYAIDADARAVACCRLNMEERGVSVPFEVRWADATDALPDVPPLDFVVMNPPFHDQQVEDRALGQRFCEAALRMLKPGGMMYLVANRHMPYEAILEKAAKQVHVLTDNGTFKVLCAKK